MKKHGPRGRYAWADVYTAAITESNPQNLPARIAAAERTLRKRLQKLEQLRDKGSEWQTLSAALAMLGRPATDGWPKRLSRTAKPASTISLTSSNLPEQPKRPVRSKHGCKTMKRKRG
jgi:hypothetical protein